MRTTFKESETQQAVIQSLRQAADEFGAVTNDNQLDILKRGFEIVNTYTFIVDLPDPKKVKTRKEVEVDGKKHTIDSEEYVWQKEVHYAWFFQKGHAWNAYKRIADFSELPVKNPFNHRSDRNRFIRACKKLFPNIDAYKAGESMTNFRKAIENIYYNLGVEGLKPQQTVFYQHSSLGGTGKSNFLSIMEAFSKRHKLTYGYVNPTNQRWIGSEYSSFLVSLVSEFMYPRSSAESDGKIITFNNITDNVAYQVEYKGQDPYFLNSKTTMFICSNRLPFDTNTRRYGIVAYNEVPYASIPDDIKEKYFKKRSMDEWVDIMTEAFESCPFGEVFEDNCCKNSENLNDLIYSAKYIVSHMPEYVDLFTDIRSCTIREFATLYARMNSSTGETPEAVKKYKFIFKNDILKAVAMGIIKPVKRINGSLEYSKYDIQAISELPTPEDEIDNDLNSIENMWERTQAAFDAFLVEEDTTSPDDDRFHIDRSNDEIFTIEDTKRTHMLPDHDGYGAKTSINEHTQFIVSAEPKKEYIKKVVSGEADRLQRCKKDYLPVLFVYESDKIPYIDNDTSLTEEEKRQKKVDEQIDMAEEVLSGPYKDSVYSVTYSGGKSVHTTIWIDEKDREFLTRNESIAGVPLFKYVWREVAKKLFGERASYLDEADATIGRITRRPGGIRDNGVKQQCWYMNRSPKGISIDDIIAEAKSRIEEQKIQRQLDELRRSLRPAPVYADDVPLLDQLKAMTSKTGNESGVLAYEILSSGTADSGSNMIGAIGYMATLAKNDSKWIPLLEELHSICHSQHPSNIGFSIDHVRSMFGV